MIIAPIDPNLNIVRNGLVLWLDPRFQTSYLGSGSTWFDISGSEYDTTIYNNTVYQTDNGGRFYFDGNNDYAEISSSLGTLFDNSNKPYTLNLWIRPEVKPANNNIRFIFNVYTTGFGGGRNITLFRTSGGVDQIGSQIFTTNPNRSDVFANITYNTNEWFYLTIVWDGLRSYIYKNATELSYASATSLSTSYSTNSTPIRLAGDFSLANPEFQGNISNVSIYNRTLTSTEITHNYNQTKVRFGL